MQFKLEENVPGVYVDKSRDFQLLCRVIDIYLCGCINRAANMRNQLDLDNCSEDLLWAIAYMQGFTTKKFIPPAVLRNICKVFPYCIKRKGTAEAVRVASYAVLSVDRLISGIDVTPISGGAEYDTSSTREPYTIYIECNVQSTYQSPYLQYLDEVLTFILPTGYAPVYSVIVRTSKAPTDQIVTSHSVSYISGITGKVMRGVPIVYREDANSPDIYIDGEHSRIGYSKIISADSTPVLTSEVHRPITENSNLIIQGNTRFFGKHIRVISGGQSNEG